MLYLCWQNDCTILGVATSEEKAQEICSELGDSYMPIKENFAQREDIDSTPLCKYMLNEGFLSYTEAIEKGYKFKNIE
jgi:hypothetical protein